MTNAQKYRVDLAARWLIGFLFLVVIGQGTYVHGIAGELHDHESDPAVHETGMQKRDRIRSEVGPMVQELAQELREEMRQLNQSIKEQRTESMQQFKELRDEIRSR